MFKRIQAILAMLAGFVGIGIVYDLVKAVRTRDLHAQESLTQALASSLLNKQGLLDKVIAAYASVKDEWASEWARLRTMQGRGAPSWLPRALKEASDEAGFYTTLLMRLTEAKAAGFAPMMVGAMEAEHIVSAKYDRRTAEDFKAAWLAGKTKIDG